MGPLSGLQIIEFAGIGPGPFCGTLLADLGADVLRVDRATPSNLGLGVEPRFDPLSRGRSSVCVDLKSDNATAFILDLVSRANGLIEGFRPGVMERLGIGPQPCLARNPALVYGRITGWGRTAPWPTRSDTTSTTLPCRGLWPRSVQPTTNPYRH